MKEKKIHKIENNNIVLWKDFSSTEYVGRMWARSESDMFCVTERGFGHYNGIDLQTLIFTPNRYRSDAVLFENYLFLLCYDYINNHNIIINGILK